MNEYLCLCSLLSSDIVKMAMFLYSMDSVIPCRIVFGNCPNKMIGKCPTNFASNWSIGAVFCNNFMTNR